MRSIKGYHITTRRIKMDINLNDRDNMLIFIHGSMYPFVEYGTTGGTWYIKSPDYDEEFKTYKSFIRFIEDEVKESLLTYALSGELGEVLEMLKEI